MFPEVPDEHKPNRPLIPSGLGVIYVLVSVVYLFLMYHFDIIKVSDSVSAPLTLAVCILFGGFMGLLDDWMDLRWRYKAFFPLIAAIPLISLAQRLELRTTMTILFVTIDFGPYYYFLILPLLVTIITNTVNQLGGFNGLETVCPAIVMIGLMVISVRTGSNAILLCGPLIIWLLLAFFNLRGRIFVGNVGSFAIGMTLASFAVISDLKTDMIVSMIPYILNSSLILLTYFFSRTKAQVSFDGKRLASNHRRSLVTVVTYRRPLTERQVVAIISLMIAASTFAAYLLQFFSR